MSSSQIVFELCECTDAHFVTVFDAKLNFVRLLTQTNTPNAGSSISDDVPIWDRIGFILHANNTHTIIQMVIIVFMVFAVKRMYVVRVLVVKSFDWMCVCFFFVCKLLRNEMLAGGKCEFFRKYM